MTIYVNAVFYYSSTLLKDSSRSMYNLFTRLNNTFSKDSSDCISTLSTALELLRVLISPAAEGEDNSEALDQQQQEQLHAFKTQPVTSQQLAIVSYLLINWLTGKNIRLSITYCLWLVLMVIMFYR